MHIGLQCKRTGDRDRRLGLCKRSASLCVLIIPQERKDIGDLLDVRVWVGEKSKGVKKVACKKSLHLGSYIMVREQMYKGIDRGIYHLTL